MNNDFLGFDPASLVTSSAPEQATSGRPGGGSVDGFVSQYLPTAQRVSERTGVAPEVLLGQWGLETGWGKSVIPGTNNLGNIKDFGGRGTQATDNQTGSRDAYRQYANADAFGDDFAGLLDRRYQSAIGSGTDAHKFFSELKRGGYAEDPGYVAKGTAAARMAARAMGTALGSAPAVAAAELPVDYAPRNADTYSTVKATPGATAFDFAKELAASAVDSVGSVGQFFGEGAAQIANKITDTEDFVGKNVLRPVSDAIRDSQTEGGKQAKREADVTGDIMDPASIDLPDTAQGWAMLFANGVGSLATTLLPLAGPMAKISSLAKAMKTAELAGDAAKAAALAKQVQSVSRIASGVGIAAGAATTGGSAAEEVRQNVTAALQKMSHEQLLQVPAYAETFARTGDETQARDAVQNASAQLGGAISAIAGGLGGLFNAKVLEDFIVKKGLSNLLGNAIESKVGRVAVGGAVGHVAEGGQELSEKVGQNVGENLGMGRPAGEDASRNSAGDVIAGGLVGGAMGVAGGAVASPSAHAAPTPAVPLNPAAAAAAAMAQQPNSPLSKAATAGTLAAEAAAAAAPPATATVDPISDSVAQIQERIRSGGLIEALRASDSPVDVKTFLNDLAAASSVSTAPRSREQALTRLEFAMTWAGEQAPAQAPNTLDELPGMVAGAAPQGDRPSAAQLQQGADRDKALQDQINAAPTARDRDSAQAQAATNREQRMRAPATESAAPAPAPAPVTPTEQAGLEAAALAGQNQSRRAEDAPRQAVIDQAMRRIEERGGVASPAEARILAEAGLGQPYDRVDASLAPALTTDQQLTQATGIALDKAPRSSSAPDRDAAEAAGQAAERSARDDSAQDTRQRQRAETRAARDAAAAAAAAPRVAERPAAAVVIEALKTIPALRTAEQRATAAQARAGYSSDELRILQAAANAPFELSATDKMTLEELRQSTARGEVAPENEGNVSNATVAPRVSTPAGAAPAFLRKRRAQLDQLAGIGFDSVDRGPDGFVLRNSKTGQELTLGGAADAQLARAAIKATIDANAHEAAASPTNDLTEPTPAQIDATNYKKGRLTLNGLDIAIENPAGSTRRGTSPDGTTWESTLAHHYGEVERTEGADGDPVDVFIGPRPDSDKVYVVDQRNEDGSFDEVKAMLGFTSEAEARAGYLANYAPGWTGLQAITEMTPEQFKAWVRSDDSKRPAAESSPGVVTIQSQGRPVTLQLVASATLPEAKRQQFEILQKLANIFGKRIKIFTGIKAFNSDGFVQPDEPNAIYLNKASSISPLAVFGHELMHRLRRENPEAYAAVAKIVRGRLKDGPGFANFYNLPELGVGDAAFLKDGQTARAPLLEELVSDLNGDLLSDPTFWREVMAQIEADHGAAAKGIVARLTELLYRLLDQAAAAFKGERLFGSKRFIDDGKEVRAAFRTALAQYVKDAGLTRTAMQAEVLRATQEAKSSPERAAYNAADGRGDQSGRDDPTDRLGRGPGADAGITPHYGEARDGAVSAVGRHYSREPRTALSSAATGTGLKGAERTRLDSSDDSRIKRRINFYLDTGNGVRPESGVGAHAHEVRLDNLYDPRTRLFKHPAGSNEFESAVLDHGFDGYMIPDATTTQGSAVLLGSRSVPVRYIGTPTAAAAPQAASEQTLKKGLLARELRDIDLEHIPGATLRAGTLEVPIASREAANSEFERIESSVRLSPARLETPAEQYAAVEKEHRGKTTWLKTPHGEDTDLTERQWVHVRTPSFKAWFGDWEAFARNGGVWTDNENAVSKAVGENGEPLVLYHGTSKGGFAEFKGAQRERVKRGELGVFMTPNASMADSYIRRGRPRGIDADDLARFEIEEEAIPGVYALFANIRDPFEDDFAGANWDGGRNGQYQVVNDFGDVIAAPDGSEFFHDADEARRVAGENKGFSAAEAPDHPETTDSVVKEGLRFDNDGAIIRSVSDDGGGTSVYSGEPADVFVAFDPEQVKSADFNIGTYDVSENDIRFSPARASVEELTPVAYRNKRVTGTRMSLSDDEKQAIEFSADVTETSAAHIRATVREHKLAHPPSQGWAPLVFVRAKQEKGKLLFDYKKVPYTFSSKNGESLQTGTPAYQRRVNAVAGGMTDAVREVFQRAESGDKAAQNILAQAGWYKAMRGRLRHEFGGLGDLFADLLGATSPNTPVRDNWSNAVDSLRRASRGDYDQLIPAWESWAGGIEEKETELRGWFNEQMAAGKTKKAIKAEAEYERQRAALVDARKLPDALLPTKETGAQYGFNGRNVVRAMVDLWRVVRDADPDVSRGGTAPKAVNFSGNLIGFRERATIDVWAARMLQRLSGGLRIPSMAEVGVSGAMRGDGSTTQQFGFGQDVFTEAAKSIRADDQMSGHQTLSKINDDDLQAVVWFIEKEVWTVNDWTSAAGEGGSFELEANLAGSANQKRIRELRRTADSSKSKPAIKAAALAELTKLERTVDRYVGGLSTQMSFDTQGMEFIPQDADMARLGNDIRTAIYEGDSDANVLASKALPTEGRYGNVERSLDLEVVAREGYDPTPLWTKMLETARDAKQDSTFLSRTLRHDEPVDPLLHRPGVEIYFRAAAERAKTEEMLQALAAAGVEYLTIIVDGRPATAATGGAMPNAVGVRLQYVPEFDQRYGADDLVSLSDEAIAAKINAKGQELKALAKRIAATVDGVSFTRRFWYETQVAFSSDYQEKINGQTSVPVRDGQGGPRGGAGRGAWRGQRVREGAALADRHARQATGGKSDEQLLGGDALPAEAVLSPGRGDGSGRDQSRGDTALEGAPRVRGAAGPDARLVEVADRYAKAAGIELRRQSEYADVDPARAARIADAYEAMPHAPQDPQVATAYKSLIDQTMAQYRALEDAGYKFWFFDEGNDPYAGNPWNAMRDLRANQRMAVFATEAGYGSGGGDLNVADNPMLADTGITWPYGSLDGKHKRVLANDLFRAVHDAFGRGLEGAGFRARGEENAWQAHARMFTGPALGAITSETRGQNSWLNFGPNGEHNRTAKVEDTIFADQKTGLMPEWTWTEGRAGDAPQDVSKSTRRDFIVGAAATPRAPIFYSQLQRAIEQVSERLATMSAPQWAQWIKANASKHGVKQDEITWSGIEDYLKLRGKDKLSRDELAAWIGENGVQVEETMLDSRQPAKSFDNVRDAVVFIAAQHDQTVGEMREDYGFTDDADYIDVANEMAANLMDDDEARGGATEFGQYTLPGGTNYRELLLTLPAVDTEAATALIQARKRLAAMTDLVIEFGNEGNAERAESFQQKASDLQDHISDLEQKARPQRLQGSYQSAHWDQQNVLAHIRVNDRTDANGKKVLFVEELQSDWAQEGRKRGFNGDATSWMVVSDEDEGVFNTKAEAEDAAKKFGGKVVPAVDSVPDTRAPRAPFVADTKAWLSLALKRVIRMAVDGGYDKVAFVNGEQSAARYDLSKQVDKIVVGEWKGGYQIIARKGGEVVIDRMAADAHELESLVGKDIAEKVVSGKQRSFEGPDLKVGGSGMIAFYDTIVPQVTRDLLKKMGGEGLRQTVVSQDSGHGPSDDKLLADLDVATPGVEAARQASFDITPAMTAQASAGLPLFSTRRAPPTDTPEFKAWFGDSKVVDEDGKPLVVYHGSFDDISVFDTRKTEDGLLHFGAREAAQNRMDYWNTEPVGQNITPVYLSIKNPLRLDYDPYDEGEWHAVGEQAYANGHDGIVYPNRVEGGESWAAFDGKQIKSAIGNSGSFDPNSSDITQSTARAGWQTPSATKFDDLVYKLQDKHIDTKRVLDAVKDTGAAISDDLDVYLKEELFHGRAAKRTEDFVHSELEPLIEEMRTQGLSIEALDQYLHARHAKEANELIARRNPQMQDGGSGMLNQDAVAYFAALPSETHHKLRTAAARVDAILRQTTTLMVDYQLESAETVHGWTDMFQHYVPLMREDDGRHTGNGTGQGFSIKGREVKSRTGSTRTVVDILANIAMQRERTIVRGEKNRVSQALLGLAQANPNASFWHTDSVPTSQVFNKDTGLVETRPDNLFKQRDNVMVAKVAHPNGIHEHAVIFNEGDERAMRMVAALKNLDAAQLEGLLGASAKVTRYFSAINTQYNPIFGVVNLVRDVQEAMFTLSSTELKGKQATVARHTLSALRGIYGDLRATRKGKQPTSSWAALWDEFQEHGGQTGYRDLFTNSVDRANAIKKALDPDAWMDSKLGKIFTAGGALKVPMSVAMKGARWIFDWLSDYNEAMENSVRLSAYKTGIDAGMSKERAASLAKNLTVNFNRKGQSAQQAGAMYAFFNASVQGTARIGQTLFSMDGGKPSTLRLSSTGKKIVYGGMLLGTVQALAMAAAGFGDDDPPEFVRQTSLIIPTGGKTYISIPMPMGLRIIPNIGRMTTEWALGGFKDTPKRTVDLIGLFADAFNPIGNAGLSMQTLAPTALDPLVALTENRDFAGRPIAKESYNKATPGHALARDTATGLSKVLSESINYLSGGTKYTAGVVSPTPDQIDYLLGQVTGGVGREYSKAEQTVTSTINGETLPLYKVPLVGRFVGNSAGQASEGSHFYSNSRRLNEIETEIKGLRKDGKFDEANQVRMKNPEAYLITQANHAELAVQKLRRQKSELLKAGGTRAEVKAVEEKITARMAALNRAVETLKARQ